jgi:hypothetical protein
MIEIPQEELLESLKLGYTEYKESVANGSDAVDLAHIKGYCVTIEQILSAYGGITKEQMLEIKRPIIGDISLRRGKKKDVGIDYNIPTIFRKQFD